MDFQMEVLLDVILCHMGRQTTSSAVVSHLIVSLVALAWE